MARVSEILRCLFHMGKIWTCSRVLGRDAQDIPFLGIYAYRSRKGLWDPLVLSVGLANHQSVCRIEDRDLSGCRLPIGIRLYLRLQRVWRTTTVEGGQSRQREDNLGQMNNYFLLRQKSPHQDLLLYIAFTHIRLITTWSKSKKFDCLIKEDILWSRYLL